MITLREAALMALKAMEDSCYPRASTKHSTRYDDAIDVLRKALDADSMASLPEPVAWMFINAYGEAENVGLKKSEFGETPTVPLYTTPPKREWQSLTDEEIKDIWCWDEYLHSYQQQMIEDIEAKLKEKNA